MLSGWNEGLRSRVQAVDSTARVIIHGRANGAADLRQQYDHFVAADGSHPLGLDSLPATCETVTDPAGVRLKAANGSGPASTIVTGYAHDEAFGGGGPFIDPLTKDAKDRMAALVMWGGTASSNLEINSVQVRLHPRFDSTLPKNVNGAIGGKGWRLDLFAVATLFHQVGGTGIVWKLVPIATAYADALGEAEGWVTFSFAGNRPRPKSYWPDGTSSSVPLGFPFVQCPWTVAMVQGINTAGGPASNIAWAFDGGHGIVGSGDTLQGLKVRWEDFSQLIGGNQNIPFNQAFAGPGSISIREFQNRVPAIQFGYAQYTTAATVVYSGAGNKLNLGSVPASPPELTLQGEVPVGTSLTGQVSADNVNFYSFNDGDTVDKVGPGLPTQQNYYLKATLTPNSNQDATPILRGIGAVVVTTTDLSDVAEVESVNYAVDPFTSVAEIPELTLIALHDGERDFRDAITNFLSQTAMGGLSFRVFIGDAKLPRSQWLYKDDFLLENPDFQGPHARIRAMHPLSLLKQALPILTSEAAGIPTSPDTSNPGLWTKSAGSNLWSQIADGGGAADDSTYIASPNNPSGAACTIPLTGIGTPVLPGGTSQLVGIEVQTRAAMASGVGPINLTVELLEGVTSRASQVFAISSTTVMFLQLKLTPAQITSIGNWSNLSLRFTATGTGTVWVTWARLAQLAMRPPLVYANASIGTVVQDLLNNQVALDSRYVGARVVDPSPAITVSKTIQAQAGGSTDLGMAKQELEDLARILGGAFLPEQGKIRYRPFFDLVTAAANGISFAPRADQLAARFVTEEIAEPISISPNYQQRVPEFDVPWGYNPTDGSWQGEARAFFAPAFTSFRQATVDADPRLESGCAQWFADATLAGAVATRQVTCFGLGFLAWRFRSTVRHPELSLLDLVSFDTDRFAAYDPVGARALAGALTATGFIVGIHDLWGTDFTLWIPTWANLVPANRATPAAQPPPTPQGAQLQSWDTFWRANHLYVNWQGNATVGSIKLATSTSAYPAAGTGTATDGQTGIADGGTWVYGDTVFITITPYAGPAGTGLQGPSVQYRARLMAHPQMFLESSGQLLPGGAKLDGQGRALDALASTPELLPWGEFDGWQSASQPYGWTVDTGDSSVAAKDSSTVFSGDFAAKYSFGGGGSAGTYRGFTTNDTVKGAFCMPLRPGMRYRVKVASRVSAIGAGESYRLTATFNVAGTLTASKVFAYAAATTYQVDEWSFTVPAAAEANSKLAIEFTRGNTTAHDYWADSLRVAEDIPTAGEIAASVGAASVELLQNGGAELGTAFWRQTLGPTLFHTTTTTHNEGARSFEIGSSPAITPSTTYRYQQCDRATDLNDVATGNPVFIPVDPTDEIWAAGAGRCDASLGIVKLGVEEYDAAQSLIQRSYGATVDLSGFGSGVYIAFQGTVKLSATTKYIVPIVDIVTDGSVWTGLHLSWDSLRMRRFPSTRRCHRYKAADQTLVASVTETKVALDSTLWQSATMDGTADRITLDSTLLSGLGSVTIRGQVEFAGPAAPVGYRQVRIKKNGTTFLAKQKIAAVATANVETTVQVSVEDNAAVPGDFYEVWATHNQGANMTLTHGSDLTFLEIVHRP